MDGKKTLAFGKRIGNLYVLNEQRANKMAAMARACDDKSAGRDTVFYAPASVRKKESIVNLSLALTAVNMAATYRRRIVCRNHDVCNHASCK